MQKQFLDLLWQVLKLNIEWSINLKCLQLVDVIQIILEKVKIFGKKGQEKTMVQILKLITVRTEMETPSTC